MRELRTITTKPELREADGDTPTLLGFDGLAARYDSPTLIGAKPWGFVEVIQRGAFDEVLEDDVRLLINHDPNYVLARTASGTLALEARKEGLGATADMAPVSYANDLAVLMKRGDINQMSFAFQVRDGGDEWTVIEDKDSEFNNMELRTITKVSRLYDVSVVTYPAYTDTDAGLRSAVETVKAAGLVRLGAGARNDVTVSEDDLAKAWEATHARALRHLKIKETL